MTEKRAVSLFLLCVSASLSVSAAHAQDAARSAGWVVIPVSEYSALRNKAFPTESDPAPPPLEATLTRVEYDLLVGGDLATGRASLTIDVVRDGWVRVPIPADLTVREARLDGKPVPLVPAPDTGKGGSQIAALLSKRGRSVLALDVAFRVTSSAGEERLTLPLSFSGITRAAVALARQDIQITVTGGILQNEPKPGAENKWIAYGRGGERLAFSWRRKMEEHRATLPLRQRGSLTQLLGLGEDSTSINAAVTLEVVQGAAKQVRIQLPSAVTVNQVQGALVADWEMKDGQITVSFLEPVEKTASFLLVGEARLPRDGAVEVPLMRLLDMERENGGVAVEVLGAGEITESKAQGLDKTDAAELGPAVAGRQSPSLTAFRVRAGLTQNRSLNVKVVRYEQEAVLTALIEEARYRVLMSREGKTLVQARYAVRNNQRNFAKIALPAGAVVWSSALSGLPARPGQSPDGALLFPLMKARAGEDAPLFPIEIIYLTRGTAWDDKGKASLTLPSLDLRIMKTGMSLFYPPDFRVTAEPGTFRTGTYEEPASTALARVPVAQMPSPLASGRALKMPMLEMTPGVAMSNSLVSGYRAKSEARRSPGLLPVQVSFPAVGPSLFLISEVTDENKGPTVEIAFQKEKGGER